MESEPKEVIMPSGVASTRHLSPPPPGFRQRPLGRATTFAEPSMALNRRRSSMFSETFSDARKSLRSSTDDLLLPRVSHPGSHHDVEESSHWHSLPLGLALLPAIGGMIFKDGSAFITDVTLLALAAIFMNWGLRMPWEWYHAARAVSNTDLGSSSRFTTIEEEEEVQHDQSGPPTESSPSPSASAQERPKTGANDASILDAQQELRVHELLALLSCFVFPMLAAWLLHGIRSQLSRPSEGLVSNYNLTIFLLVAEIRPLSHLIKMIQRRTLFLQRTANFEALQDQDNSERLKVDDLLTRVEELEARVADGIASTDTTTNEPPDAVAAKASAQATSDLRRSLQPEIDALSRAMRRYEKRSTISAVQQEARMQELETRVKDVVVLAAAAQRNADRQPRSYTTILTNWLCALVVVPIESLTALVALPYRFSILALSLPKRYLNQRRRPRDQKNGRRPVKAQSQDREKRTRTTG